MNKKMTTLYKIHTKGTNFNIGFHFGLGTTIIPLPYEYEDGKYINIRARLWIFPFLRLIHWNKKLEIQT